VLLAAESSREAWVSVFGYDTRHISRRAFWVTRRHIGFDPPSPWPFRGTPCRYWHHTTTALCLCLWNPLHWGLSARVCRHEGEARPVRLPAPWMLIERTLRHTA